MREEFKELNFPRFEPEPKKNVVLRFFDWLFAGQGGANPPVNPPKRPKPKK